jgi:hypothetical protein
MMSLYEKKDHPYNLDMDGIINDSSKEHTQINIYDLYRDMKEIKEKKNYCYNQILYKVHDRIKRINKKERYKIMYDVPEFVFGLPNYNINKCIAYVIKQLRGNGFLVRYYFPKILYISWDPVEIQDYKKQQRLIKNGFKDINNKHLDDKQQIDDPNNYYTPKTDTQPMPPPNISMQKPTILSESGNASNVPGVNLMNTMGGASFMSPPSALNGFSTGVESGGSDGRPLSVDALMQERQKDMNLLQKLQPNRTQHNIAMFKPMLQYDPNVIPTHNYYAYSTLNQKLANENFQLENGPRRIQAPQNPTKVVQQKQKEMFNHEYQKNISDYYGNNESHGQNLMNNNSNKNTNNHPFKNSIQKYNSSGKFVLDLS